MTEPSPPNSQFNTSGHDYGTIPRSARPDLDESAEEDVGISTTHPVEEVHGLQRGLSARQVQMIAIAGTIGTGLFLGALESYA